MTPLPGRRDAVKTTRISVGDEQWDVPRGFGREYQRIAAHEKKAPVAGLADLIGLIGYTASDEEMASWPLRKRVELTVYAANVHMRASDNPMQRHPRLEWLPEAWTGPPVGEGLYAEPGPTPLGSETP